MTVAARRMMAVYTVRNGGCDGGCSCGAADSTGGTAEFEVVTMLPLHDGTGW
jgi:hypothetical protein